MLKNGIFYIITMLDLLQQQQPLKLYEKWNSSFFPAQPTVQIFLPHWFSNF